MKVELAAFADGLKINVREGNKSRVTLKFFGLSNWKDWHLLRKKDILSWLYVLDFRRKPSVININLGEVTIEYGKLTSLKKNS